MQLSSSPASVKVPLPEPRPPPQRPGIEDCLCFNARLLARRLTEFYEARLAPHGVNLPQFGLLATIGAERAPSISQLAQRMALDPSTLSRTLRPLEQAGLIAFAADPDNLRVRRVRLTPEGKTTVRAAAQAWAEAQADAAAALSPDAMKLLVAQSEGLRAR